MIKTVTQTTIADVFSITSDKVYKIPKYQREYTWGIKEWDALFNDVTENDFGYFLGSYICVNSGSLNGTTLEVIDGQQRFSTITLLLAALYFELSNRKAEMDEDDLYNYDRTSEDYGSISEINGLKTKNIEFSDDAITAIVKGYTIEAGVRNLERQIDSICRKVTTEFVKNAKFGKRKITAKNLKNYFEFIELL